MNHRIAALAVSASVLFAAGWTVNGWRVGLKLESERAAHNETRETYQRRLAEGLAEAETQRARLQAQADLAVRERDAEISRLADAASRIPDFIRVRVPAACPSVPASADPSASDSDSPDLPGGVVSGGMGEGDRDLDIRRATELMRLADQLSADLRAVMQACSVH